MIRGGVILLVLALSCGCALRGPSDHADGSLDSYVGQARELSVRARPAPAGGLASSVEAQDPVLSAALLELAMVSGPAQHRRVADRLRELKILDAAYDHFARARQLDPTDAAAY